MNPAGPGLVLLVDPQEAVAQDEDPGVRIVAVRRARVAPDHLHAADLLGRDHAFERRHLQHPDQVAEPLQRWPAARRSRSPTGLDPASIEDSPRHGRWRRAAPPRATSGCPAPGRTASGRTGSAPAWPAEFFEQVDDLDARLLATRSSSAASPATRSRPGPPPGRRASRDRCSPCWARGSPGGGFPAPASWSRNDRIAGRGSSAVAPGRAGRPLGRVAHTRGDRRASRRGPRWPSRRRRPGT